MRCCAARSRDVGLGCRLLVALALLAACCLEGGHAFGQLRGQPPPMMMRRGTSADPLEEIPSADLSLHLDHAALERQRAQLEQMDQNGQTQQEVLQGLRNLRFNQDDKTELEVAALRMMEDDKRRRRMGVQQAEQQTARMPGTWDEVLHSDTGAGGTDTGAGGTDTGARGSNTGADGSGGRAEHTHDGGGAAETHTDVAKGILQQESSTPQHNAQHAGNSNEHSNHNAQHAGNGNEHSNHNAPIHQIEHPQDEELHKALAKQARLEETNKALRDYNDQMRSYFKQKKADNSRKVENNNPRNTAAARGFKEETAQVTLPPPGLHDASHRADPVMSSQRAEPLMSETRLHSGPTMQPSGQLRAPARLHKAQAGEFASGGRSTSFDPSSSYRHSETGDGSQTRSHSVATQGNPDGPGKANYFNTGTLKNALTRRWQPSHANIRQSYAAGNSFQLGRSPESNVNRQKNNNLNGQTMSNYQNTHKPPRQAQYSLENYPQQNPPQQGTSQWNPPQHGTSQLGNAEATRSRYRHAGHAGSVPNPGGVQTARRWLNNPNFVGSRVATADTETTSRETSNYGEDSDIQQKLQRLLAAAKMKRLHNSESLHGTDTPAQNKQPKQIYEQAATLGKLNDYTRQPESRDLSGGTGTTTVGNPPSSANAKQQASSSQGSPPAGQDQRRPPVGHCPRVQLTTSNSQLEVLHEHETLVLMVEASQKGDSYWTKVDYNGITWEQRHILADSTHAHLRPAWLYGVRNGSVLAIDNLLTRHAGKYTLTHWVADDCAYQTSVDVIVRKPAAAAAAAAKKRRKRRRRRAIAPQADLEPAGFVVGKVESKSRRRRATASQSDMEYGDHGRDAIENIMDAPQKVEIGFVEIDIATDGKNGRMKNRHKQYLDRQFFDLYLDNEFTKLLDSNTKFKTGISDNKLTTKSFEPSIVAKRLATAKPHMQPAKKPALKIQTPIPPTHDTTTRPPAAAITSASSQTIQPTATAAALLGNDWRRIGAGYWADRHADRQHDDSGDDSNGGRFWMTGLSWYNRKDRKINVAVVGASLLLVCVCGYALLLIARSLLGTAQQLFLHSRTDGGPTEENSEQEPCYRYDHVKALEI